jgi:hypothetical protein
MRDLVTASSRREAHRFLLHGHDLLIELVDRFFDLFAQGRGDQIQPDQLVEAGTPQFEVFQFR